MPDISTAGVRLLPYPLRNPISTNQDTPSDLIEFLTIDVFPADPDERATIKLELSLNEYVALSSAIDVGRDIAFSTDTTMLWWLWARVFKGLASGMTCAEIIECIETDSDTIAAIHQLLINAGMTPNNASSPNVATETLLPSKSAENLLSFMSNCDDHARNMAIARGIVRELDESVEDAFQTLELITNANEAAGIIVGAIPVIGTGAKVMEMVDWIQQTVVETYQAAYNQSAEDTIACAIYCHIEAECEVSLNSLLTIYEELATITVPTIDTIDDLIDFVLSVTMNADVTGVALFQFFLLRALKFGGVVFDLAGFNDLATVIKTAATYQDFSYESCEDCPPSDTPTTYWALYYDYRLGTYGTTTVGSPSAANTMWNNNGYQVNPDVAASVSRASWRNNDMGAQYVIKAAATRQLRRGSIGNGTNDFSSTQMFPNANCTGTPTNGFGASGVTSNENDVIIGQISPLATGAYRSWQHHAGTSGDPNAPAFSGQLKIYEHVVWGEAGAGNTKPPGAAWAGNTLPSVIEDLFPPFV